MKERRIYEKQLTTNQMTNLNTIYQKLLSVQKEVGAIKKDSENPFYKSMYFDINSLLAVVKPVLNKYDLILLQGLNHDGTNLLLDTQIIDSISGEKISFNAVLPQAPDAQKQGSVVTYFRRYALQSLLALEAEDDDGNASKSHETAPSETKQIKTYSPSAGREATEKQKNFHKKLTLEKGEQPKSAEFYATLDAKKASEEIDRLMKKSSSQDNGGFEADDFIEQEYHG